ncbi:unnamed protein product [Sympodiomycopsis kandeliae]
MAIIAYTVSLGVRLLAALSAFCSFVIWFTVIPFLLAVEIWAAILYPMFQEAARSFRNANRYWGWDSNLTDRAIRLSLQVFDFKEEGDLEISGDRALRDLISFLIGVVPFLQDSLPGASSCILSESKSQLEFHRHPHSALRIPCPMADLPPEIKMQIFLHLLHSTKTVGTYDCTPLMLSSWHRDTLRPRIYASVHVATQCRFRLLRETLAVTNPSVGKLITKLILAANSYDHTGYVADPIASQSILSTGIEQLLLGMPNLSHIALDLYCLAAIWDGNVSFANHRLESGPKPLKLSTELTFPQYLDLPMHDSLEELEVMCFGLDIHVAQQLRESVPNLKRLVIRLVRRKGAGRIQTPRRTHRPNGVHAMRQQSARPVWSDSNHNNEDTIGNIVSDGSSDQDSDADDMSLSTSTWSDTEMGRSDADEFAKAIDILRSWPLEEGNPSQDTNCLSRGARLEGITVLAWPSAIRDLQKRFQIKEQSRITGCSVASLDRNLPSRVVRRASQMDIAIQDYRIELDTVIDKIQQQCSMPTDSSSEDPGHKPFESLQGIFNTFSSVDRSLLPSLPLLEKTLPLSPLRLDLDRHRHHGPRKGCVMAWVDEFN